MTVRPATTTDVSSIHELGHSVAEFSENDETVTFWPKELLENAVQSEDVIVLVAEEEIVIGLLVIGLLGRATTGFTRVFIDAAYFRNTVNETFPPVP